MAGMISVLERNGGAVEIWPGTDVAGLDRLPGDEAEFLAENGWRSAYFKAVADGDSQRARLTLGRPLASVVLDHRLDLMSHDIRGQARKGAENMTHGARDDDGFTRLPSLLAVVVGPGSIDLVACPEGTGGFDYWTGRPEAQGNNFALPDMEGLITSEEAAAIEGLYRSMAVTSHELFARSEPLTTAFAGD